MWLVLVFLFNWVLYMCMSLFFPTLVIHPVPVLRYYACHFCTDHLSSLSLPLASYPQYCDLQNKWESLKQFSSSKPVQKAIKTVQTFPIILIKSQKLFCKSQYSEMQNCWGSEIQLDFHWILYLFRWILFFRNHVRQWMLGRSSAPGKREQLNDTIRKKHWNWKFPRLNNFAFLTE